MIRFTREKELRQRNDNYNLMINNIRSAVAGLKRMTTGNFSHIKGNILTYLEAALEQAEKTEGGRFE